MPRRTLPGDRKAKMRSARKAMALTALETKAQQFTNPKLWALVLLLLLVALNGCVSLTSPADRLSEHPKRAVRYPARAGQAVGMAVGIPLSIVLCPVTVPYIYLATEGGDQDGLFVILPLLTSRNVGTICVGGPSWLLFGWWGRTEPIEKPRPTESEVTEAIYFVGNCYLNGSGSIKKDEVEAYIHFLVAASRGHEDARKMLSTLESRLTQTQIAEGKQRAQIRLEERRRNSPPLGTR